MIGIAKLSLPFLWLSIIVISFSENQHVNDPMATRISPVRHFNRLINICTNTCYMSNMYRLRKYDSPDRSPSTFAALIMLALSGDIELNPGPPTKKDQPIKAIFPCGVCQLAVNWSDRAVECENCKVWLHKTCASLDSTEFNDIENASWNCYCCRSVNVSSFIYNAYNLNVSNSFSPLAGIPGDDSVFLHDVMSPTDCFQPGSHSSP